MKAIVLYWITLLGYAGAISTSCPIIPSANSIPMTNDTILDLPDDQNSHKVSCDDCFQIDVTGNEIDSSVVGCCYCPNADQMLCVDCETAQAICMGSMLERGGTNDPLPHCPVKVETSAPSAGPIGPPPIGECAMLDTDGDDQCGKSHVQHTQPDIEADCGCSFACTWFNPVFGFIDSETGMKKPVIDSTLPCCTDKIDTCM